MPRAPLLAAAVLTLALEVRAAEAQRSAVDSLPAGARVRVDAPPRDRFTATLLAYRGDTLLLLPESRRDTVRIPLGFVDGLEVSAGTRTRMGNGAALGFVGGFAAGAILGVVAYHADDSGGCVSPNADGSALSGFCPSLDFGPGFAATAMGLLGGGVGLVAGLIIGAAPVERWQPVQRLQRSSRVRVVPTNGRSGPGLVVALAL